MNLKKTNRSVCFIDIDETHAGQRIDNFLLNYLNGVPKGHIYKIIRKGEVRVNKGRIRQTYKLSYGDRVRIPPISVMESPSRPSPGRSLQQLIDESIVYEDDYFIAINKPSGVAVHGGSGVSYGIIEAIRALKAGQKFLELVHRLDKDTSGCLLIAKKRTALNTLQNTFRNRETDKRYLALLCGHLPLSEKKVSVPLLRELLKTGDRVVRVDKEGKEAVSVFNPIEQFTHATLSEIKILTGRTHQIRVHAQYLGHCVAGDEKYGNFMCNKRLKEKGLKRLFLHASQISFKHPQNGAAMTLNAPLSDDLENVLLALR